jgi:hypothetical protein
MFGALLKIGIGLMGLAAAVALSEGGVFEIDWYTVDGGGGMNSTGGDFDLSGTIGQADAGGPMTGGDFALTGGFWTVGSGGGCTRDPQWVCDGDVDGNGAVNPVDVGLVQAAFCAPEQCTPEDLCQYDIDCNGAINPVDAGLVQSLFGLCNAPRGVCP